MEPKAPTKKEAPKAPKAPQEGKEAGAKTAPKPKKEPTVRRSKFEELYGEKDKITLLVDTNPKKEGSKARERFQHYFSSKTVQDYLQLGGTYQDIAYDVGRQFIKVGQ